ncbi:MAG: enoyl-CoA hydratase/isomerase family protein [Chloroflexi bacterium]|nr:enoyl-CoA hydratase/isomerase family protein [Chloroflexota bacterium]
MQPPNSYEEFVANARKNEDRLVLVERDGDHAVVRLNDPGALNALSASLSVQLLDVLTGLAQAASLRSVVLIGSEPAFSAGGDIRAMVNEVQPLVGRGSEGAVAMWRWIRYQFGGVVRLITRTDKAFIAAVNGACAGVGMAFVLACDLILASERARFVSAFGRIGLVPEVGTGWQLTRRLGYQKTFELFVSGRALSAAEAKELGLVNEVVAPDELLPRALEWCQRISKLPAHSLAMAKPLLRSIADMTWEQAIAMEEFAEPMCFTTEAHREAIQAFLEKRR